MCLYDFSLVSRLDHRLGREEIKGLLYSKERAHIPARYHQAILHEWIPRMWSVNYGVDVMGNVDKTEWFSSQFVPSLAALFKRDASFVRQPGARGKENAQQV